MKFDRWIYGFLWFCAATLATTGLLKLISVFGQAPILETADPLLGIKVRFVLLISGLVEVIIATALCLLRNPRSALWLVSWMGFNFLLYRSFRTLDGEDNPCPCLGTVLSWLQLNPTLFDGSLWAMSAFMFLGGSLLLWKMQNQPVAPRIPA
ncbi:MAG: hypothetical protein KJ070_22225 [Verrucomicrobia bacterium]|nr:hypothetical protein [Verrucomicrobiota bacterium]